jgi:Tol biopolymer transport system component
VLNDGLALDGEPVMTESGCAVAFLADQGDTVGLWLAAADGSSRRRIYTAEQMGGGAIAFNPDADKIVAVMGGDQLRRIDTEDGEGEPFDLSGDYEIDALSFSPGEDSLAFIGRQKGQGGPAALWIVDHLGGYASQIQASLAPGADQVAWSFDNRKIAVSGSGGQQVVYLKDGTTTTIDPGSAGRPSWLPDSSAVIYAKTSYRPASTGLSLPVGTIVAQPLNGDPARSILGPKPELADPQWALEGAFP